MPRSTATQSEKNSPDSEATLPYGLVERLSGHDLLNETETQSLFVNQGSNSTCRGSQDRNIGYYRGSRDELGRYPDAKETQEKESSSGEQAPKEVQPETSSGERAPNSTGVQPEKARRYPQRDRKKLNKYGENFLQKLLVSEGRSVEMIDKEKNLRVLETLDDITQVKVSQVIQEVKPNENVNESRNGTMPTVLKVDDWFDEANNSGSPGLTRLQVNEMIQQSKVAMRQSHIQDPEELIEEFLNGPYFADPRESGHTNARLLKKLCVPLDDSVLAEESPGPKQDVNAVGTTECVRGGLCLKDRVVKQIKAI